MSQARLNFAIEAAVTAAKKIRRLDIHRGDLKVEYKSKGNPVTNADIIAEDTILQMIEQAYPTDGLLCEESGVQGNQDSCWVIDPIDGTANFVNGLPTYAVSIAWCKDGQPTVGVIYDICQNEMYSAELGRGAKCDQTRIRVSNTTEFANALIGSVGSPGIYNWRWDVFAKAVKQAAGFRRFGSATLDFAYAACGKLDVCFGANLHYWDYAAGNLILKEAGGSYVDVEGSNQVEFGKKIETCIFGNSTLVEHFLEFCKQHNKQKS